MANLSAVLEQIEHHLEECKPVAAPQPVGHTPPFTGDMQILMHCVGEAYTRIKAGDLKSEALYTHLAQALGEAAVLAPLETDGPQPVGGGGIPWISLILLLLQALGEEAPE